MSTAEVAEFLGYLFAAWASGFASGYMMTMYKRAMDAAV